MYFGLWCRLRRAGSRFPAMCFTLRDTGQVPPPSVVRERPRKGGDPTRAERGSADECGRPVAGADRVKVRRAVTLVVLSALVPGSAQLLKGNRRVGRFAVRVWLGLLGTLTLVGLFALVAGSLVLRMLTATWLLSLVGTVCFAWAVLAAGLLLDAWRLGRPVELPIRARRWLAALTLVLLVIAVYPPVAVGRRAMAAADLIGGVLSGTKVSTAVGGRYNVLLLGGDAGPDRVGVRPDSVTLASIDTDTGRTVLFSLPRNLENVPFRPGTRAAAAMPKGFSCGDTCLLNAVYTWAQSHHDLFPGVADVGAEAMKQAVEGVTGLTVNYYVLIDLAGFAQLIDAMGGIRVTVAARVPIGGGTSKVSGYIEPGIQRLDGYHALWLARSRHGTSDYDRMGRQRCVMSAMLQQLDPATVLERFQGIAAAGRNVVSTDVPGSQLATFLELAMKAKSQKVRSVQFVPPLINPAYPDFARIRATVTAAVKASQSGQEPGPTGSPATSGTSGGSGASGNSRASGGSSSTHGTSASATPGGHGSPSRGASGTGASGSGGSAAADTTAAAGVDVQSVCRPAA